MADFEPVEIDFMYGGNTQAEGKKIEQSLESIAKKSQTVQDKVNQVGKQAVGFNNLNMSVQQVVRELPSAALGINMFMLAISNNIPILADNIQRTRAENELLKKSGQSTVPVWKQVAKSIFSWQSLMITGITLGVMFAKDIVNAFSKGSAAANKLREDTKKMTETMASSVAEPLVQYRKLQSQWNDLGDDLDKKKKFVKANEDAFRDLGVEVNNVSEAENVLVRNTAVFEQAMIARARATAAAEIAQQRFKEAFVKQEEADRLAASKPSGGNKFMSVLSEGYAEQMPGAPAGSRGVSPEEILASQVKKKQEEVDRMMREAENFIKMSEDERRRFEALLKSGGISQYQNEDKEKATKSVYDSESAISELIADLRAKRAKMEIDLQKDSLQKRLSTVRFERDEEIRQIEEKEAAIVSAYNKSNKGDKKTSLSQIDPEQAKALAQEKQNIISQYGQREVQETEKYQKEVSDIIFKYADERTRIAYNYNKEAEEARELGLNEWAAAIDAEKQERIDKITIGLIEETELYRVASDEKLQLSRETTQLLIEDLKRRIDAEVLAGKLSKQQADKWLNELTAAQQKMASQQNRNNPFAELRSAMANRSTANAALAGAPVGTSIEELAKLESASKAANAAALGAAGASLQAVNGILQQVVAGLDQLGLLTDEQKKDADNIIGMVGGAANIAMGLASGNPMQVIQGSIDLLVNGIEYFDFKNKELEKKQRQHIERVKELELRYQRLQRAVDKALGTDIYAAQRQQIENQKKQIAEYEAWLAAERKKKKNKQDAEAIADTEAKIEELKNSIQDTVQSITETLTQTSVKDLASELSNAIVGAFQDGESAALAMGEVVDNVIRNAVINALKLKILDKLLAPAIDQFAVDMESGGGLSDSEAARFRNSVTQAGELYFKALNEANDALGGIFTGDTSAGTGIKGDVAKLTEETGSALVGQIVAMRLNVASLLANSRDSLDMISRVLSELRLISGYASHLKRIDETLYYMKLNGIKAT
ncbi:MAG: hypothetical protein RBT57_02795 [Paludibacter sp.]|jgi:hypothetical protein|nr:hypothetical protein [Paludibacter sp.]